MYVKGRTGKGDIIMDVCCRPPDQEEQEDEALNRHTGEASCSQALILMGNFNHPDVYWRNTAGQKQSKRFLECVGNNFLLQVIDEPTRRGDLLDLILTKNEGLVGNVKVTSSLGCSDSKMVVQNPEGKGGGCKQTLDFRRAHFKDLFGQIPWVKDL